MWTARRQTAPKAHPLFFSRSRGRLSVCDVFRTTRISSPSFLSTNTRIYHQRLWLCNFRKLSWLIMASSSGNGFRSTATPLPSPSAHQHNQTFSFPPPRQRTSLSQPQRQSQPGFTQNSLYPSQQQQPQQQQQHRADTTRGGPGDSTASSPFLKDFNLVAEAAKRAQMAVLMRDLGDVAL